MSILPAQHIRARCVPSPLRDAVPGLPPFRPMIEPFSERTVVGGLSSGLSSAGYDVTVGESFWLLPFWRRKSFTVERFVMPTDLVGEVVTKSSWARRFVTMPNTRLEPGWRGHITLEIINHLPIPWRVKRGTPIGCVEFKMLLEPTEQPYSDDNKYQDQPARAVPARMEAPANVG